VFVVIFKAKIRRLDAAYAGTAARMRELALRDFGCIEFNAVTEGLDELALSYWPSEENIKAWRAHPEHVEAQRLGKQFWYESYSVQIAEISREYRSASA
jgi:heme-degrading monooxygenase HmoA